MTIPQAPGERGRHPADPTGEKFGDTHWPMPQPHERGATMKYMLIDMTTVQATCVLAVASLKPVQLLAKLAQAEGRTVIAPPVEGRGLAKVERLPLQYLFWNLTQRTPPDDYSELCRQTLATIEQLPVDKTPLEDLEQRVAALAPVAVATQNQAPVTVAVVQQTTTQTVAPKVEGDRRPKGSGTTARVWQIADECLSRTGAEQVSDWKSLRAAIMVACESEAINSATAATQYSRWKAAKLKG